MKATLTSKNILARVNWPGSAVQLALFRVALGGFVANSASAHLFEFLQFVPGTNATRTVFPGWFDAGVDRIAVPELQMATQVLGIALALGLLTRFVAPLLFVSTLLLFSYVHRRYEGPVPWLYVWFPLLVMCFSRCADQLSLDALWQKTRRTTSDTQCYRWPVELVAGWFAYIYVAAALAKIFPAFKGAAWLAGGTVQQLVYERFLESALFYMFGRPFFDYSEHAWVFGLLAFGALALELSTVVIYLTPRFNVLILGLLLVMHAFLHSVGVTGFITNATLLGICLLPPEWFGQLRLRAVTSVGENGESVPNMIANTG